LKLFVVHSWNRERDALPVNRMIVWGSGVTQTTGPGSMPS
jgi:hypothetical protein